MQCFYQFTAVPNNEREPQIAEDMNWLDGKCSGVSSVIQPSHELQLHGQKQNTQTDKTQTHMAPQFP